MSECFYATTLLASTEKNLSLPSSVQRWKKESPRLKAGAYPSDGSRVTVQLWIKRAPREELGRTGKQRSALG